MQPRFCIIIPARYESTRFPGKPLAEIGGKSMIQRVYEVAKAVPFASEVIVATDDARIYNHVANFGQAVYTSNQHPSGTDRCCEAYANSGSDAEIIVNIQGDEPFIKPEQVLALIELFKDESVQIATLKKEITSLSDIADPNQVKVVCDVYQKALYFSRSPIPFNRNNDSGIQYFRHLGMYAYRKKALFEIADLAPSILENAEKLEQLRWLENGYHIAVAETQWQSPAVDTPEDLEKARQFLAVL